MSGWGSRDWFDQFSKLFIIQIIIRNLRHNQKPSMIYRVQLHSVVLTDYNHVYAAVLWVRWSPKPLTTHFYYVFHPVRQPGKTNFLTHRVKLSTPPGGINNAPPMWSRRVIPPAVIDSAGQQQQKPQPGSHLMGLRLCNVCYTLCGAIPWTFCFSWAAACKRVCCQLAFAPCSVSVKQKAAIAKKLNMCVGVGFNTKVLYDCLAS